MRFALRKDVFTFRLANEIHAARLCSMSTSSSAAIFVPGSVVATRCVQTPHAFELVQKVGMHE
jgi:hypothetical protein